MGRAQYSSTAKDAALNKCIDDTPLLSGALLVAVQNSDLGSSLPCGSTGYVVMLSVLRQ